jgi:hypothetical protein
MRDERLEVMLVTLFPELHYTIAANRAQRDDPSEGDGERLEAAQDLKEIWHAVFLTLGQVKGYVQAEADTLASELESVPAEDHSPEVIAKDLQRQALYDLSTSLNALAFHAQHLGGLDATSPAGA